VELHADFEDCPRAGLALSLGFGERLLAQSALSAGGFD